MAKLTSRPCGQCGEKKIKEVRLKDVWVNECWKDFPRVYLSHGAVQLQCQNCKEFAGTRSTTQSFDDAARASIQDQMRYFIEKIKRRSRLPLKTIAERLSIGYQHLSDLKNGHSFPSYHYWSLLSKVAKDPDLLDRFKADTTEDPPMSKFG